MALTATMFHLQVDVSDVDRNFYEALDLRLARHPSESMRYMLTRALAYCLAYTDGIAFSKAGIASTDDPPIAVHDPTGLLLEWIDVGNPSADRLHRATKAARSVSLYTHTALAQLQREAASRPIHKLDSIAVWRLEPAFLDALGPRIDRNTRLELMRNDGQLYATIAGDTVEGSLTRCSLVP
ncbi:MAG: YaeQ family protein [Myxococcales bacterium]|nr:YaeQ family protein [Myxococcales bacterium]